MAHGHAGGPAGSTAEQPLAERLRARGLRLTAQRQRVLAAVTALEHATPESIGARLREEAGPDGAVPDTSTGGVSDGCWTAGAGLPTLDGLGPVGALDHSPDEYIEIGSIAPRCGLLAGLVAAVDAGLR